MSFDNWMTAHKELIGSVKDVVTVAAVITAGFWTVLLASQFRDRAPRLSLDHKVVSWRLPDGKLLVRVHVQVTNTGKVLVSPVEGRLIIQRFMPLSEIQKAEYKADRLIYDCKDDQGNERRGCTPNQGLRHFEDNQQVFSLGDADRSLEPGETDSFWRLAVVEGDATSVEVYSRIFNPAGAGGWLLDSTHEIGTPGVVSQSSNAPSKSP